MMRMNEHLENIAIFLLGSAIAKPLMIILAIFAAVVMLASGLVFWHYKVMTAIIFTVVSFLFLYVVYQINPETFEDHGWLILIPLPMFLLGYLIERLPVSEFKVQPTSLSSLNPISFQPSFSNLVLIFIILLAVIGIGLSLKEE